MGGRKKSSRKPVVRKPPPPLDKVFPCPFCANERVVTCKLDKKTRKGTVHCKVCNNKEEWSAEINDLTADVDLYNDWIEACLEANRQAEKRRAELKMSGSSSRSGGGSAGRAGAGAAPRAQPLSASRSFGATKGVRRDRTEADLFGDDDDDDELPEMPSAVTGRPPPKRAAMDYTGVGSDDDDA